MTISKFARFATDDAMLRKLALPLADRLTPTEIAKILRISVAKVREIVCASDLPRIVGPTSALRLRDLRTTLVHEHGHRVVAAHYRVAGRIAVSLNPKGGLLDGYYVGQFQLRGRMPTARSQRLVGLAGAVANLIAVEPEMTDWDVGDCLDADNGSTFSETDRQLAIGYSRGDVAGTLTLLRRYWPALTVAVDRDVLTVQGGTP